MSSVDTGNADRDGHLQSTDFFDVETKPKMTFASESIEDIGDGAYRVSGTLTLNGQSNAQTLDVRFFRHRKQPTRWVDQGRLRGNRHHRRTAYGIDWNVPLASGGIMLGTDVNIALNAQLVGPAESAPRVPPRHT